jgi:MraZ protein
VLTNMARQELTMQSLDEYDDWDTEEHRSYEPAVKGVYMGYEMSSCCGDGSLSIPQRFLDRNPGRFQSVILSMNVEGRVLVYPVAEWLTLQRRVFDAWTRPGMQRLRQLIRGGVTRLSLHEYGYLKLPRSLRKRADLDRGIVMVGYENHLEMWSEYSWKANELGDYPDLFARDLRRLGRIEASARARQEEQGGARRAARRDTESVSSLCLRGAVIVAQGGSRAPEGAES